MKAPLCSLFAELLAGRDADRLSGADESLLRRHLAECAACAEEALRHDPVLIFSRAAGPEALSSADRERFVGAVLSSVAAARAARRSSAFHRHAGLRLAASILLAVSVAGGWWAWRREAVLPEEAPVARAVPAAAEPLPAETLPAVEELSSADAIVYQFPATEPGEATVVFVVDRNADI